MRRIPTRLPAAVAGRHELPSRINAADRWVAAAGGSSCDACAKMATHLRATTGLQHRRELLPVFNTAESYSRWALLDFFFSFRGRSPTNPTHTRLRQKEQHRKSTRTDGASTRCWSACCWSGETACCWRPSPYLSRSTSASTSAGLVVAMLLPPK